MEGAPGPNVHWLSAQQHFSAGDFNAAIDACQRVINAEPLHSAAHLMMANLLGQRDQYRLSVEHALQAASKMGSQPLQHIAAVSLRLITVGEYERAYRMIRKINPAIINAPPFLVEFAQQLSLIERHEDALRFLDAAIGFGAKADSVAYIRGNFMKFLGKMDESANEYERALAINPDFSYAHWALAYLETKDGSDASNKRIDRIRQTISRTPSGRADLAYLFYALFKELDGTGDTEAAWQALHSGAASKRAQINYDAAGETALFAKLMAMCGPGFLDAGSMDESTKSPIFILGMPRTGTTLLERILGGNPKVTLCGELNDFRMQFKWATDHHCLGFIDTIGVDRIATTNFPELGLRYLQHVSWRSPDTHYFSDKNPGNFMLTGLILKALPQARIIHLKRNAMDSCFSNLKELFAANSHAYSYDFADLASHYHNYTRLMAHWHRIAPGQILDVNYEDLVSTPAAEARRVMAYCGLDFDPAQIEVESSALPVSTASSSQVRQPIHKRNIGGWKRYEAALEPLKRLIDSGN